MSADADFDLDDNDHLDIEESVGEAVSEPAHMPIMPIPEDLVRLEHMAATVTDVEVQERLVENEQTNVPILVALAKNPALGATAMERLSECTDSSVRYALARHPKIEWWDDLVVEYSRSDDVLLRAHLANNNHTPPYLLRRLGSDEDVLVRESARRNMNNRDIPSTLGQVDLWQQAEGYTYVEEIEEALANIGVGDPEAMRKYEDGYTWDEWHMDDEDLVATKRAEKSETTKERMAEAESLARIVISEALKEEARNEFIDELSRGKVGEDGIVQRLLAGQHWATISVRPEDGPWDVSDEQLHNTLPAETIWAGARVRWTPGRSDLESDKELVFEARTVWYECNAPEGNGEACGVHQWDRRWNLGTAGDIYQWLKRSAD